MTEELRDLAFLRSLADSGLIAWRTDWVTFKNPKLRSHVYVGGREDLTHHPLLLTAIGGVIARHLRRLTPALQRPLLIGIPSAGRTLAQEAATHPDGMFPFEVMREKKKRHGAHQRWIDGPGPQPGFDYVTLDNTITDGESKFETFERLAEDGYDPKQMVHLILVDRGEGGVERLTNAGYRVECTWSLDAVLRLFCEHKLWPLEQVRQAFGEIARNRAAVFASQHP